MNLKGVAIKLLGVLIASVALLVGGGVMNASASTMYYLVDFDGDGRYESVVGDRNGDGHFDYTMHDLDGNGLYETVWYDANLDGYFEVRFSDMDHDGGFDIAEVDTNLDGQLDTLVDFHNRPGLQARSWSGARSSNGGAVMIPVARYDFDGDGSLDMFDRSAVDPNVW
ncbi:hypothetical protein [Aestuariimicrobium sp. Y1814]|uniref:hypothetical protein n=1 Tax=Aestuariimicrobium sp. Y1814 TaxID=3418742 RepID=UPI003DA6E2DB